MSSPSVASQLSVIVATRDSAGEVASVRMVGIPGAWSLPCASVDAGETPGQAVRRLCAQLAGSAPEADGDVLIEDVTGLGTRRAALIEDPAPAGPAARIAVDDLALIGVDQPDGIPAADLRAIRVVLAADDRRAGRDPAQRSERLQHPYAAVAQRHITHTTLMWQAPGLSLAAQAFLLTLALGADTDPWPRIVAALIALVLSVVSVQLLRKHSHHELVDRRMLERLELLAGWPVTHGRPPSSGSRFVDSPSRTLWAAALWVFAAAAVAVIVAVVLQDAELAAFFTPSE